MTRQLVLKQVIVLFYLLLNLTPANGQENFAHQLLNAHIKQLATPHYSQTPLPQNEAAAYVVQEQFVNLLSQKDPIAGYKAGLTSPAGQKKFKVTQALSGVLFSSGHIENASSIKLGDAGKLMIETEIGFILGKPISQPVDSIESLKDNFTSVVSVIEFPDIGFVQPKVISGLDLIAANVASHQYLIGEPVAISKIENINQVTTQLTLNDQAVIQGIATDALGDQWQALYWLVNQLISQGYQLSEGELLITGALGKMIPAKSGVYQANFEQLGKISFKIIP